MIISIRFNSESHWHSPVVLLERGKSFHLSECISHNYVMHYLFIIHVIRSDVGDYLEFARGLLRPSKFFSSYEMLYQFVVRVRWLSVIYIPIWRDACRRNGSVSVRITLSSIFNIIDNFAKLGEFGAKRCWHSTAQSSSIWTPIGRRFQSTSPEICHSRGIPPILFISRHWRSHLALNTEFRCFDWSLTSLVPSSIRALSMNHIAAEYAWMISWMGESWPDFWKTY